MGRHRKVGPGEPPVLDIRDNGVYEILYWNEDQRRTTRESTGERDEARAKAKLEAFTTKHTAATTGNHLFYDRAFDLMMAQFKARPNATKINVRRKLDNAASVFDKMRHEACTWDLFGGEAAADLINAWSERVATGDLSARRFVPGAKSYKEIPSYKTINRALKILKQVGKWACENNAPGTKTPYFPKRDLLPKIVLRPRPDDYEERASAALSLELTQIKAIEDKLEARRVRKRLPYPTTDQLIFTVTLWAGGQRAQRVGALRRLNVNLQTNEINFANLKDLGNNDYKQGGEAVPIMPQVRAILEALFERDPKTDYILGRLFTTHQVAERVRQFLRWIGINHGGSHVLRKTFATQMGLMNMGALAASIMGISLETYDKYYFKRSKMQEQAAVQQLAGLYATTAAPMVLKLPQVKS